MDRSSLFLPSRAGSWLQIQKAAGPIFVPPCLGATAIAFRRNRPPRARVLSRLARRDPVVVNARQQGSRDKTRARGGRLRRKAIAVAPRHGRYEYRSGRFLYLSQSRRGMARIVMIVHPIAARTGTAISSPSHCQSGIPKNVLLTSACGSFFSIW